MRLPVDELMPEMPERSATRSPATAADDVVPILHPEDDPMEKHDHPLAWQRLGDLEAGLGAAATLSFADAEAIREMDGVQYVACGVHGNARVHVPSADKRWFTRMHGTDLHLLDIKRTWTLRSGRFFTDDEQDDKAMVLVLGSVVAEKLFGEGVEPGGQGRHALEPGVRGRRRGDQRQLGGRGRRPGDDEFDAVYMPYTTTHQLLNLTKLNDITVTAASTGERVGAQQADRRAAAPASRHHHREARRLHDLDAGDPCGRHRRAAAERRGGDRRQRQGAGAGHARTARRHARTGQRHDALAAGGGGRGVAAGRRHRHHEHHAAVGHRTHQGDRPAHGGRRPRPRRDPPVPDRSGGDQRGRRPGRHRARAGRPRISISSTLRWATVVSPAAVLIAFGVSAAVGVLFGWYPARRAAELDPIDALRHE